MYILKSNISTNDETKQVLYRDELINNDNAGVKHLFDFGFGWSYPAGDLPRSETQDPSDGDTVRDVSKNENNGVFEIPSGVSMTHVGGGILLDGEYSLTGNIFSMSAVDNCLSDFSESTSYINCMYVKLPSSEDMPDYGSSIVPLFSAADQGTNYSSSGELCLMALASKSEDGSYSTITSRLQRSLGTVTSLTVQIPSDSDAFDNEVVQIATYVKDGVANLSVKSESLELLASSSFTGNSEDITDNQLCYGTSRGRFSGTGVAYKVYRGFFENLDVSGRDPETVLSDDYDRTISRGVFS